MRDAYKDPRFSKEIDPTTGTVVRSCLVSPIMDKHGVIGRNPSGFPFYGGLQGEYVRVSYGSLKEEDSI